MSVEGELYDDSLDRKERLDASDKELKIAKNLVKLEAEQIRQEIDTKMLIGKIHELAKEADMVEMEELPRVKLKLDVYSALLRKVLPDLKAMEVRTGVMNTNSLVLMVGDLSNNVISGNELRAGLSGENDVESG